jgi:2-polyprenyl-3-methyl-5-hydroxy-6-metoxy-1,4-benzoquinol methylase
MDVRFFLGGGYVTNQDEVILPCPDDYRSLPLKCKLMFQWALDQGYDYVFKTDDDVLVAPDRLLEAVPVGRDYVGRLRGPARGLPAPYCSGMGYWLSRKAMQARVDGADVDDFNEDLATGNILLRAGISGTHDHRYVVARSDRSAVNGREGPRKGNDTIASCEYVPEAMHAAWKEYLTMPAGKGSVIIPRGTPFDQIDVMVKTFLRDGLMMRCTKGIEQFLPGARIVLVDDGWESKEKITYYAELRSRGHVVLNAPFDSGYGAKNNIAQQHLERPYVLRIADDFSMGSDAAAEGVLKLLDVLRSEEKVGIASGRVNEQPYEANVSWTVRPDGLKDMVSTRLVPEFEQTAKGTRYARCFYTVNYSLIRKEVIQPFVWDEKFKIGGDHLDLYLWAHEKGWDVAWVEGVNVNTLSPFPGSEHKEYRLFRSRAKLALPHTFKRHGWASWTDFNGFKDTLESVTAWADAQKLKKRIGETTKGKIRMKKKERKAIKREFLQDKITSRSPYMFHIKAGYRHRTSVPHFDATGRDGDVWQKEVYELAKKYREEMGLVSVLDIGCGDGGKLLDLLPGATGLEVEPTLSWLRANKPEGDWVGEVNRQYDLVVCADVIEHVLNPDDIIQTIKTARPKIVVISTPERSLIPGAEDGPPPNKHHVREWTLKEFNNYLRDHFDVLEHYVCNQEQWAQVAVCRPYDPV